MKKRVLAIGIAIIMLAGLSGCGEPAAETELEGTWVGKMPGEDEIITEWGFRGMDYHMVTYLTEDYSGNIERGNFTLDDGEAEFNGRVKPLGEGDSKHVVYTISYTLDDDTLTAKLKRIIKKK